MSIDMILILVISFLSILILTVSIASFISKSVSNKKEAKEEHKYDIESLEENASLSSEIKAANKEEKKAKEVPQNSNKFVVPENTIKPQTIISNQEPAPETAAPKPTPTKESPTPQVEQTPIQTQGQTQGQIPTTPSQEGPIDPFHLNS